MYEIPNKRTHIAGGELCRWFSKHRCACGNLRDPNGPQVTFAAESFIDELAAAAKADPLRVSDEAAHARSTTDDNAFRRARSIAVIEGGSGGLSAGTPGPRRSRGERETFSPGAASRTPIAVRPSLRQIAEVEVNRQTGHVWVKRMVCAHDCGLVDQSGRAEANCRRRNAAFAQPDAS